MQEENLIPANEFCLHHQIEMKFIYSLQEYGLLELTEKEEVIFLSSSQLQDLEKMVRLHYDLDVNLEGIDVITQLLKKLEAAHEEMDQLKKQLKFYKGA
jgi:hypothetical protein